jgi:hypothetical protein
MSFRINAQTRFADAFKTSNNALIIRTVLQENTEDTLFVIFNVFDITNETFTF